MGERLVDIFSRHLGGDSEMGRDLAVGQFMGESQDYRSAAFRTELPQYRLQLSDPLSRVELPLQCGRRLGFEVLARASVFKVPYASLSAVKRPVLLHEVVGNRVEVDSGIADARWVAHPQHAYVHLLCQVGGTRFAADAAPEERL
jgi:hypothetical protein